MQTDTLFVVLGDSPRMPTGLGRIAGDIAWMLDHASERLGIEVVQVGWESGCPNLRHTPHWPLMTFPEIGEDWGAAQVCALIEQEQQARGYANNQVVLLTVWDPARCFDYRNVSWETWGYFAVDGHNQHGRFGGPAAETVQCYDRVLGYTRYGAKVLSETLNKVLPAPMQYLPHGIFWTEAERLEAEEAAAPPAGGWRLGCVATNQPRKDLGLFFATIKWLRDQGERVYGWLHTDELVTKAWSIPELMEVHGLEPEWVAVSLPPATNAWLRQMYASCAVTLAPGRGEGFCYPIVESLAMGRGVVHCDYGGGAELTPVAGRVAYDWYTEDNPYCIQRPLLRVGEVAEACSRLAKQALEDPTLAAFYSGSVAHLHWSQLGPRWESWAKQGLVELRACR